MRQSRLLSILLLLQARGRMSARALADELEISLRTVHRDIDELSAAGVPVYAERGRTGGFELLEGYRTRLTGLTPGEAETLFLAGLPGPAADLGLGEQMAQAQLKLLAALPGERREDAGRVASRFHLDPVGWFRGPENAALLPTLAEAVWSARRIRIRYESWTDVVRRELEPLGIVLKAGVWYLVAAAGGKPRTYRVSGIEALEVTEEPFARPDAFDLAVYWRTWASDFEARLFKAEAVVRLSPSGLRRLCNLTPAVGDAARRTAGPADTAGWVRAVIPIETLDHAVGDLMALGPEIEVLEPPELRTRMTEAAQATVALYSPHP